MPSIVPHLWFNREAKEAAVLYTSLFEDSAVTSARTLPTPSGDTEIVSFVLAGQPFMAISAGPLFKFNPSVSFLVACASVTEVDRLWASLSEGGQELMPIGAYRFSGRYGWVVDRFGVSWQIMHAGERQVTQRITPTLMFSGALAGRAEEAVTYYASIFPDSAVEYVDRYGEGDTPDRPGTVRHTGFQLLGQRFAAMDSARVRGVAFNEAISLIVTCETQEEIDFYWERLSAVPEAEQCGWLKDRYGLSWQVAPSGMEARLAEADGPAMERLTRAFLGMKKFDLAALDAAYAGT